MCKWQKVQLVCYDNDCSFPLQKTKMQYSIFKYVSSGWQIQRRERIILHVPVCIHHTRCTFQYKFPFDIKEDVFLPLQSLCWKWISSFLSIVLIFVLVIQIHIHHKKRIDYYRKSQILCFPADKCEATNFIQNVTVAK